MPSSNATPAYNIITHPQQPCVFISNKLSMTSIPSLAPQIGQLLSFLASQQTGATGPPFFRYRSIPHDMVGERAARIDVGFPIAKEFSPQASHTETTPEIGVLPSGRYVETNHVGAPETLAGATKTLLEYAKGEGLELDVRRNASDDGGAEGDDDIWGGRFEWYETNPTEEPDMSKWVTRLSIKLR